MKYLKKKEINKNHFIFLGIVLFCLMLTIFTPQVERFFSVILSPVPSSEVSNCELKFHIVDVGQAEAMIIEFPDNKIMLIDSGTEDSFKYLKNYLDTCIFYEKDKVIDYFLLTHPDADHSGGGVKIFEHYDVKMCFRPNVYSITEYFDNNKEPYIYNNVYDQFVKAMDKEKCKVEFSFAGAEKDYFMNMLGYDVTFLSPVLGFNIKQSNDYSPIVIVSYAGKKIMLTGDATSEHEQTVLDTYFASQLDVDILKVAHHGSNTSSSDEFLKATTPDYAVISVSEKNTYNLPNFKVLSRLKFYTEKIYLTSTQGDVAFGISSAGKINVWTSDAFRILYEFKLWHLIAVVMYVSIKKLYFDNRKVKKK